MDVFDKFPKDLQWYLTRNYFRERDSLALALSGASPSFTTFFWENRMTLTLSHCCYLSSDSLKVGFLTTADDADDKKLFRPANITRLNASHLHWVPAADLSSFIKKIPNLQELNIEDTKILLADLATIFESCKNICKLSFTLAETNLDQFRDGASLDLLKEGFSRVINLRIITFAEIIDKQAIPSWLVILGVLSWCKDCVNLLIDITYYSDINTYYNAFALISQRTADMRRITALISSLESMKSSMKSLVILQSGSVERLRDLLPTKLLMWLLSNPEQSRDQARAPPLERIWVDGGLKPDYEVQAGLSFLSLLSMKSYALSMNGSLLAFNENDARFQLLEHLGEVIFRRLERLANLKFAKGRYLRSPDQGFNEFCSVHSQLEVLLFKPISLTCSQRTKCWCPFHKKEDPNWSPDWSLMNLKILGNGCIVPCPKFMDYVVVACPNIQELHLGVKNGVCQRSEFVSARDFFSAIKFKNLQVLTVNGMYLFDGYYLPKIFANCLKLERLHLGGTTSHVKYFPHLFLNLGACLPGNLRDLRLKWKNDIDDMAEVLTLLKAIRKRSPRLERLVLYAEKKDRLCDPRLIRELEDYLVTFVKTMPELVALCLSGFQFNEGAIESVKQQFTEQIIPARPAFWFHLDRSHPNENDTSVPRIHNVGIVNPIDWYDAPPKF